MQLFALDESGLPVAAAHAFKQRDYFCMECGGPVRLRSGIHRRKHFFHVNAVSSCRLNGKSLVHVQAQCAIQNQLPQGECQLEVPFPAIGRIADVVWEPKKLIFEIQCSPITREEVLHRNRDYRSQGYTVVWILHDSQFNGKRASSAELALREGFPYHYTNIDRDGNGLIYDQFDLIIRGMRCCAFDPMPIRITHPFPVMDDFLLPNREIPLAVKKRVDTWTVSFEGDLIHALSRESAGDLLKKAAEEEKRICGTERFTVFVRFKKIIEALIVHPYRLIFQMLLEKASR